MEIEKGKVCAPGRPMLVVAAAIVRNGRVLACQRSRAAEFPLKWEFPGGKVQSGESPETGLVRELREELNVNAAVGAEIFRTSHKYPGTSKTVELIFFAARIEAGEIENRVFERIEWVDPQKLPEMDFLEADRELIGKLASGEIGSPNA